MDKDAYLHILDDVSDGVVVFDKNLKINYCNQTFIRMSGFDRGDLEHALCGLMQGPETDPQTIAAINQALADEREFTGEILNYRKSGETFWNELSFRPMRDADGSVSRFIGFSRDVTDRKLVETRVFKLEREYQFIAENVLAGIIIHNPDSTIRYMNPKAKEMLGIRHGSVASMSAGERGWQFLRHDGTEMPPDELPFNRALAEGATIRGILLGRRHPDRGQLVWALCDAFLAKNENGQVAAVLVSFTDVTRLIESEIEASAYRERFELAARASQDVIFEWDITTGKFLANEAFEAVYGYSPPEIMGYHNIDARNTLETHTNIVSKVTIEAIASGKERFSVDHMIARPDGSIGHVIIRAFIVRGPDGSALRVIGTATDVGHLTAALRALEESETRFRIIADTVSDVLWDHNFDTGESWITPDWTERLNLDTEIENATITDNKWLNYVNKPDRERLMDSYRSAIASDATEWQIEYRMIGMSHRMVDVAVNASILRNPDGSAYRVLGNVRDITAIKRQQEGYTRSRALEAVGQLTGGVAHDFNNLLMIIQGNAELLAMSLLSEQDTESVALITRAADSAATLTRRLLTFSGQTRLNVNPIDIPSFVEAIWPLLRAGLPESISLQVNIADDIWQPLVDMSGLEQAIVNLVMNAKDAMLSGGEISIIWENHELRPGAALNSSELRPGRYITLSVCDTGSGMLPTVQGRAFEPYFTTKEFGKGTGLGLSTVYGFATQSGGTAMIYSEEGRGTTVSLYLPATDASQLKASEKALDREPAITSELKRILVVEDQPEVRAHVVKLLTRLGYAVASAGDALQALTMLEEGQTFDLLYTDIIMPGGMNGQELSKAAEKIAPGMKVLFTSGYPASAFEHLGMEGQSAINILRKPYKSNQLQEAIACTLAN